MVATQPLMLVSTDCASAMAKRPQTMTRARSATAPTSLRVRIDIADSLASQLRGVAADYMVRAVSCKQDDARTDQSDQCQFAAGAAMAADLGCNDIAHVDCRWSDTAHGIRTFNRRMEAGHRCLATAFAGGGAGRVRQIPGRSAVSRTESRYGP